MATTDTIEHTVEIPAGAHGWRRGDHDSPPKLGLLATMRAEPGVLAWIVAEWCAVAWLVVISVAFAFIVAVGCYALLEVAR